MTGPALDRDALLRAFGITDDDPKKKPAPQRPSASIAAVGRVAHDHPGEDPENRFRRLVESPFADSLRTLAGSPSAYSMEERGSPDEQVQGEYGGKPPHDTVYMTPEGLIKPVGRAAQPYARGYRTQPEYVLEHEMGHRLDATNPQGALARAPQDSIANEDEHDRIPGARPGYWQRNRSEHYAEAFANAITLLRQTSASRGTHDLPATVAPILERFERDVPGTKHMVAALLQEPLYHDHPLNQATRLQPVAADATAVRR